METLQDFGNEVAQIREAINRLEVKGEQNAALIVFAFNRCNNIIKALNEIVERQSNPPEGQNGVEEGDVNGKPNSGTSE